MEPQLRAYRVMRLGVKEDKVVLLDGGATHCLRQAKSRKEWEDAEPTTVQLAAGSISMRMNKETGTLLSEENVQPIVPVAKMTEVGYKVAWSQEQCRFEHPETGVVPTALQQGCPVVDLKTGMKIMEEVEEAQRKRAKIRAILACGMLAESGYEKKSAELKSMFPEVPDYLLERIVGTEQWDGHRLPFNRRTRRKIEKATTVVVHLFSGGDPGRWARWEKNGVAVLCLDLLQGADLHDGHLSAWLDELLDSGKISMWVAGPPCRTVSICRQREDDGPRTLRARAGPGRFGLEGLTEQEKATAENVRWVRRAMRANPGVEGDGGAATGPNGVERDSARSAGASQLLGVARDDRDGSWGETDVGTGRPGLFRA